MSYNLHSLIYRPISLPYLYHSLCSCHCDSRPATPHPATGEGVCGEGGRWSGHHFTFSTITNFLEVSVTPLHFLFQSRSLSLSLSLSPLSPSPSLFLLSLCRCLSIPVLLWSCLKHPSILGEEAAIILQSYEKEMADFKKEVMAGGEQHQECVYLTGFHM